MEKFHKYCLSVLLVIICSNISAQISNGTIKNEDCKQLYELYSKFLNSGDCHALERIVLNESSKRKLTINDKKSAVNLLRNIFFNKFQKSSYQITEIGFSEKQTHSQLLNSFLKEKRDGFLAQILYFKSKVSKIRNKDYLDIVA